MQTDKHKLQAFSLQSERMDTNSSPYFLANKPSLIFYLIFILASCLILAAGRGDLWLDEIWSLFYANTSSSAWKIMQIRHDNNHLLNTLYLYVLGDQERLYLYRFFAIASGIGSIYLVSLSARAWGRVESIIALLLTGTSYPLILNFSEARGYSPAIFFAILTFVTLQKYQDKQSPSRLFCIWSFSILGVLSHLTFIIFLLSIFIYSVSFSLFHCSPKDQQSTISNLFRIYFIPFSFITWLYFFFIRHLTFGGGPIHDKMEVLYNVGKFLGGLPDQGIVAYLGLIFLLLSAIVAIALLYLAENHLWVFYTSMFFIVPALLVLVTKPKYLYFRYFIICFPFYYHLMSYLLGRIYRTTFRFRIYAVALIITSLVFGHSLRILPLLRYGRGNYTNAMEYIARNSKTPIIKIGSDHDFRNGMVLKYYSRVLGPGKQLQYINRDYIMMEKPEWLITQSQDLKYTPPMQIIINNRLTYDFAEKFSYSGVSGWNWYVFKLAEN